MFAKIYSNFLFNYLSPKIPIKEYQLLKLGDQFICSLDKNYNIKERLISNTGACGSDKIPALAKIKAISEFVERQAYRDSNASSTFGFAAYPFVFNRNKAIHYARLTALQERIEKYAWVQWGNNENVKCTIFDSPYTNNVSFYTGIQKEMTLLKYYRIMPSLENIDDLNCTLLYALTDYGWVCGAAAKSSPIEAERNALKELYMSCIALYRAHKMQIQPESLYEQRLIWISEQDSLIQSKVKTLGKKPIQIPDYYFENFKTEYADCYSVQQCSFKEHKCDFNEGGISRLYL